MEISIGRRIFTVFAGKISNDSYSATIKKLALLGENRVCQLAPARIVAGPLHLSAALARLAGAVDSGRQFSANPNLEFLVRLLGERQIAKAIDKSVFGKEELVLVIEGKDKKSIANAMGGLGFEENKSGLAGLGKNRAWLMEFYGISENEIKALTGIANPIEALVVEKTAFVGLEK